MGKNESASQDVDSDRLRTSPDATDVPEPADSDLAAELATTKDRLLRCLAENENIRRQSRRDRDEAVRYAAAGFAGDLLATADSLERAIASVSEEKRTDEPVAGLLAGVEATRRALLEAFARHGLQRLDPTGQSFDPHWHEAGFEVVDQHQPPGTVVSVIRPGYLHYDRLLRPALVGVSKAAEAAAKDANPDEVPSSRPAAGERGHAPRR
jgi:molecular chaperone GrpE